MVIESFKCCIDTIIGERSTVDTQALKEVFSGRSRVNEKVFVRDFFDLSEGKVNPVSQVLLPNNGLSCGFFDYPLRNTDRAFIEESECLLVECKIYREKYSKKKFSGNTGYAVREAFGQLIDCGEYARRRLPDRRTCQEGAVVVFDMIHRDKPLFLARDTPTMKFCLGMHKMAQCAFGMNISLFWIWKDSQNNWKYELDQLIE